MERGVTGLLPPRYEVERGIEGVRFLRGHIELRNTYIESGLLADG